MENPKNLLRILIFLTLISAVAAVLLYQQNYGSEPIDSRPDSSTPSPEATFMLPDNYFYRQDDAAWGALKIGDTTDTMRAYGCTISSVAMAASNLTGTKITPGQLVTKLSDNNGFTDRGWLIWDKLPAATDGKVSAKLYNQPDHSHIQNCLDDGHYPLVKFYLGGTIVHWGLIVGTTAEDYLIRDPLYGGPDDPPVPLSERAEQIHSLRCIVGNG